MSRVTCHMSRVTCHVSRVMCHVSRVTCHMSFFFKFLNFFFIYFFFTMPPPKKNIGSMIRIGREIQCLPYAGFFLCFIGLSVFIFFFFFLLLFLWVYLFFLVCLAHQIYQAFKVNICIFSRFQIRQIFMNQYVNSK